MLNENAHVIYADVDEKVVKSVILYSPHTTEGDWLLYYDEDCTIPVLPDEALELYLKNLMIVKNYTGLYQTPINCNHNGVSTRITCSYGVDTAVYYVAAAVEVEAEE